MASFKEIRKRINSIKSTRKTTSAMRMVSSSKLHKAENEITNMQPYSDALYKILASMLTSDYSTALATERPVRNVAIVAFSSDSSLCGAFNSNIIRELQRSVKRYSLQSPAVDNIYIYTVGKKVYDAVRKSGIKITQNLANLAGKSDYNAVAALGETLIEQFADAKIDRVEMIYHHFKSAGSQTLVCERILPVACNRKEGDRGHGVEFILEPSHDRILQVLIPKSIKLKLFTALLDSNASEHAARMIAMQTATDNADDLVTELTVAYNKSRQQAITNELLDIAR
ncbi:MAG: ATP synthase F1 subunit gamma [Tannerella sp.]|jgi:F-type H+-transporting ATPase subunit gamma|nr:ATP synthase F1 subunit gamma [Tannerella sp.]